MTIHYFAVQGADILEALDVRNTLINTLENQGFDWIDATGGQAAFVADNRGDLFKNVVQEASKFFGVTTEIKTNIADPGLGLF